MGSCSTGRVTRKLSSPWWSPVADRCSGLSTRRCLLSGQRRERTTRRCVGYYGGLRRRPTAPTAPGAWGAAGRVIRVRQNTALLASSNRRSPEGPLGVPAACGRPAILARDPDQPPNPGTCHSRFDRGLAVPRPPNPPSVLEGPLESPAQTLDRRRRASVGERIKSHALFTMLGDAEQDLLGRTWRPNDCACCSARFRALTACGVG
jgi:hypothetical protein